MRVVITGGAGFIGVKLAQRLLRDGFLANLDGDLTKITKITLFDQHAPLTPLPRDQRLEFVQGDVTRKSDVDALLATGPSSVFHLAAVVSSAAEADLDLGLAVNLDGTRFILDACRDLELAPRLIFASSAAIYGGELPFHVTDTTLPAPRTSYGAQKMCGELLVSDYSRRGIIDGRSLRLPTIVVRPGRPNKAASTFASSILREPLAGSAAICPVNPETRMAILSPRRLIDGIIAVHNLDANALHGHPTVLLPSLSVSIAEIVEGLRAAGGDDAVGRIAFRPDPLIQTIVDGWPERMQSARADTLGLSADGSIAEIINAFIEDDLPAQRALPAGGALS